VRQQPNSAPVSPLNLDEARRLWHRATEVSRQRALVADTELRRRHPGMQFPPLRSGDDLVTEVSEHDVASDHPQQERGEVTLDVAVALEIARQVRAIVAERECQAGHDAELDSDDVMQRRETEALTEVAARPSALLAEASAKPSCRDR
jgi:hypothetical protein